MKITTFNRSLAMAIITSPLLIFTLSHCKMADVSNGQCGNGIFTRKVRAFLSMVAVIGAMLSWHVSTARAQVYWGSPALTGTGSTAYDWNTDSIWDTTTNGPLVTWAASGATTATTAYFIGNGTNTLTVNTAENLNGGSYPSQIHIGDVGASDNAVITLNYNQGSAGLLRCSSYLGVGWSAPDAQSICTAIFNVNANVNVTGSGINVGRFGSVGIINLDAGTLTCSGVFSMANGVTSGSTNAGQATLNINSGKLTGVTTFTIGAAGAANAVPVPAIAVSGSNTVAHATVNINDGIETQTSSGTVIFCNGNNTVGTLNLNGGQMLAGSISKGTGKTNTLATFNFNGGTLIANKSSITFMPSGFDAVNVLSGGAFINTSNFNITIGSNLQDGGGGLTLSGTGTLTLSGTNNTYTGPTIIDSGALLASGLNGTASVMVGSNTFGAYGNVAGPVLVSSNGILTAFQTGVTLSMASLTLGATPNDTMTMNFTANGAAPLGNYAVRNSGGLTNNGTCTVNLSGVIFSEPVPNTNTLITYNGTRNGSGTFVLGATPGVQGYLLDTGTAIDLVVTNYTALTWVGTPANTWDTLGELVWQNAGTPASFANGDEVYFDNTALNFNVNVGSGVNPGVAIISSSSNYTFSGRSLVSTNPLYMEGPGSTVLSITGNSLGALNLDGGTFQLPGSDTISTLNLAGGTLLVLGSDTVTNYNWTGGNIQIDNGGSSGLLNFQATTTIPSGGTLLWDRSDSYIYSHAFAGGGSFALSGSGTGNLTLTAATTYTGTTTVTNGTLTLDAGSTLGLGSMLYVQSNGIVDCLAINALGSGGSGATIQPTIINAGGLLTCDGNSGHVGFNKLTLNGGELASGSDTGDAYGTYFASPGNILATADSTISAVNMTMSTTVLPVTVNSGVTLTVSGYWNDTQGAAGAGSYANIPYVTFIGPGKVVITADQTYTGDTTVTNGAVLVLANGAFLDSSNIVVAGGTVDVTGQSDGTLHLQNQPYPGTGSYNFGQSLLGVGMILGNLDAGDNAVTVAPGGSYWAGTTGAINVSGSITLGGTTRMELNRDGSPNCDQLVSLSSINYGGTLIVTNIGGQLHAGDTFILFGAATGYNGSSFSNIVLPNYYTWDTSQLAVNGSISVVTALPSPTISSVDYSQVQNGILTFNAINGAANESYTLLTSTNLALPLRQWSTVVTGNFDGGGNLTGLSVTNIVGAQRFYTLSAQ